MTFQTPKTTVLARLNTIFDPQTNLKGRDMRRTLPPATMAAAIVALSLACAPSEAPQPPAPEDFAEAKTQGISTDKPILIDFYATW